MGKVGDINNFARSAQQQATDLIKNENSKKENLDQKIQNVVDKQAKKKQQNKTEKEKANTYSKNEDPNDFLEFLNPPDLGGPYVLTAVGGKWEWTQNFGGCSGFQIITETATKKEEDNTGDEPQPEGDDTTTNEKDVKYIKVYLTYGTFYGAGGTEFIEKQLLEEFRVDEIDDGPNENSKYVYAVFNLDVINGTPISRTIQTSETIPNDQFSTPDNIIYTLGRYYESYGSIRCENTGCGSIQFSICRAWYKTESPFYYGGITRSALPSIDYTVPVVEE